MAMLAPMAEIIINRRGALRMRSGPVGAGLDQQRKGHGHDDRKQDRRPKGQVERRDGVKTGEGAHHHEGIKGPVGEVVDAVDQGISHRQQANRPLRWKYR